MVLTVVMITEGTTPHGCGVDLALTSSAIAEGRATRENAMMVSVKRDGAVYFRNTKVSLNELTGRVHQAVRDGTEKRVFFRHRFNLFECDC